MSSTRTVIRKKKNLKTTRDEMSPLKIFVCAVILFSCMITMILAAFVPSMIKFAKPEFVAIFAFMCLFNTILFLIFDE